MGKMTMLNTKLPNGDSGRDCEVEEWCHQPAYVLSSSREPVGVVSDKGIQRYKRTIRYKCLNGHRFDRLSNVEKDLLTKGAKEIVL